MKIKAVIIIPNYNGISLLPEYFSECISSILGQSCTQKKVFLVDDGSTDDSVGFVKNNFPEIDVLRLNKNTGFTKAISVGINYAQKKYKPKYIALANNDVKPEKNWLEQLIQTIESDNKIAAVASNMFFSDNTDVINSQGGVCNFFGQCHDINCGKKKDSVKNIKNYVLYPCFGATLISADIIKSVGLMDERYFSYYEDADWGWRANLFGYKIIFDEKAIVYHKGSATWKNFESKKTYLLNKNSLCTIIKNYEIHNLIEALFITFLYYSAFFAKQLGQLIAQLAGVGKRNVSIPERIKLLISPFKSIIWNIANINETLKKRRVVQNKRMIEDKKIFELIKNGGQK
jgi:GT2 family glycosyltransferase